MSWVAEEKPSATAAKAIAVKPPGAAGSARAMPTMAPNTASCASNSQPRRRPSRWAPKGAGSLSMSGAQTNLNE